MRTAYDFDEDVPACWKSNANVLPEMSSIEAKLASMRPSQYEKALKEPKQLKFTNIDQFFRGGMHGLIVGTTGCGKTTLLQTLHSTLIDRGHTILARDDGGLESLYLLPKVPIRIWIPDGCELRLDTPYKHDIVKFDHLHPGEILDRAHEYKFNLVVFDSYCLDPGTSALFYSSLFRQLIFKCMQTPESKKERMVFSIDEINDLIQPRGMELSKDHSSVRALIEYNVRKLRKHRVTLLASAHRFAQLGISVRSQFSYLFVKQNHGYDAYDFLSKSLKMQNKEVFWATVKDISSLDKQYYYLFDNRNRFDKYVFEDIRREKFEFEMTGAINGECEDVNMRTPNFKRKILTAYYTGQGMSSSAIADKIGVPASTIRQDHMIMRKEWGLNEIEVSRKRA